MDLEKLIVRLCGLGLLLLMVGSRAHSEPDAAEGSKKPLNVLLILADDLNTALSGYGHPECKTPNLDRLARESVRFTRAFCQFPICGPSRASIMTGQYPLRNGVLSNGGTVDPERVTLPRHFANHGYWTGRVSKIYHMGIPGDIVEGTSGRDHLASWTLTHDIAALETLTPGKVVNYTTPEAASNYPEERSRWQNAHQADTPYKMPRSVRGDYAVVEVEDRHEHLLPDRMAADRAIDLLRQRAMAPESFFLAVGFVRPHFPFVSTTSAIAPYDAAALSLPASFDDAHDDIPEQAVGRQVPLDGEATRQLRRGYYGAIGFMDRQVGRLLDELDRLELREQTIVVFVSDHGYLMGEHNMWKKSVLWEEAIRVPLMVSVPGGGKDAACHRIVELVDLYPTLTELARLPQEVGIQGLSLVPLLKDPQASSPRSHAFIQVGAGFGLRSERWAYMWYPAKRNLPEGAMLYDMERDPYQRTNLSVRGEHAETVDRLHTALKRRVAQAR